MDPRRFNIFKDNNNLPENALKSPSKKWNKINKDCLFNQFKSFATTYFSQLNSSPSYNLNKLNKSTPNESNSNSNEISDTQ